MLVNDISVVRPIPSIRRWVRSYRGISFFSFIFVLAFLSILSGCETLDYEGWLNKPIPITMTQNIPIVHLRYEGMSDALAAIDTSSPVTTIFQSGSRKQVRVELRLQDGLDSSITRFIFRNLATYDIELFPIGLTTPILAQSLLGTSLLKNFAIHLRYGKNPSLTFKDEIPDENVLLAKDCDLKALISSGFIQSPSCVGVFSTTLMGGGLIRIGEDYEQLPSSRIVLPLCLLPNAFDLKNPGDTGAVTSSGVSAMAVLATGLGMSVMSRSALEHLRAKGATIEEKTRTTLYLPYGQESVSIVALDQVAVVSDETIDLGPCGELALRRRLFFADSTGLLDADKEKNGASVALVRSPVEFAVLNDEAPFLQGLRKELLPYVATVDVILGGSFLKNFEVDIDYPGSRVILGCAEQSPCEVMPWCGYDEDPRCIQVKNP